MIAARSGGHHDGWTIYPGIHLSHLLHRGTLPAHPDVRYRHRHQLDRRLGTLYLAVDLRVDEHAMAVAELRRLFEVYRPLIEYFQERAANPTIPSKEERLRAQARQR
jgi:hypothetical protein